MKSNEVISMTKEPSAVAGRHRIELIVTDVETGEAVAFPVSRSTLPFEEWIEIDFSFRLQPSPSAPNRLAGAHPATVDWRDRSAPCPVCNSMNHGAVFHGTTWKGAHEAFASELTSGGPKAGDASAPQWMHAACGSPYDGVTCHECVERELRECLRLAMVELEGNLDNVPAEYGPRMSALWKRCKAALGEG